MHVNIKRRLITDLLRCATFLLVLASTIESHAEAKPRIEPREKWRAVFADTKVTFTFDIESNEAFIGRLIWHFSVNQRTIARGDVALDSKPNDSFELALPLNIPPVKDGVILRANLTLFVYGEDDSRAIATFEKPIWIYPTNPFADRTGWLKELNITLFDPVGDTADRFKDAEIPFTTVRNVAAIADLDDGVLIVGEGTSLIDHRALPETLIEVAAAGVPVLCLAPADGSIPLPSVTESELPLPLQMQWRRHNAIIDLDKRFDSDAWPGHEMIAARFALESRRGLVSAVVDESKHGWPWLELQFPDKGAALLFCGFGIVRGWNDGPTPRFLLARLLESLNSKQLPASED